MHGRALIAWNLRKIRTARGVSQERLAADAGVDRAYVSEIERELGNVSVDVLDRMATALGCQIGEFLQEPESNAEKPKALGSGRRPA